MSDNESLLTMTADIVAAHVSHNAISVNDVAGLIPSVYGSLAGLSQPVVVQVEAAEPFVPVKRSVKDDHIVCLNCGKQLKMIKRHVTEHGLTLAQYFAHWNLPKDYPTVAPAYALKRRELALKIGLGKKPGARKKLGVSAK